MSALRYTDLNPVRAGLAQLPWDWPWSSARVHAIEDARDPVLDPDWAEYCGRWDYRDWRETLRAVVAHALVRAVSSLVSTPRWARTTCRDRASARVPTRHAGVRAPKYHHRTSVRREFSREGGRSGSPVRRRMPLLKDVFLRAGRNKQKMRPSPFRVGSRSELLAQRGDRASTRSGNPQARGRTARLDCPRAGQSAALLQPVATLPYGREAGRSLGAAARSGAPGPRPCRRAPGAGGNLCGARRLSGCLAPRPPGGACRLAARGGTAHPLRSGGINHCMCRSHSAMASSASFRRRAVSGVGGFQVFQRVAFFWKRRRAEPKYPLPTSNRP